MQKPLPNNLQSFSYTQRQGLIRSSNQEVQAIRMNAIKRAILRILKHTGFFQLIATSRWRREKLLILCYHGISLAWVNAFPQNLMLAVCVAPGSYFLLEMPLLKLRQRLRSQSPV